MNTQRWRQIDELFHTAVSQPAAERARFLERDCLADLSLRAEVESLLAAHEQASSGFIEQNAFDASARPSDQFAPPLAPGERIGRYELRRILGRGGSGIVYEARQDEPSRIVALKVMRSLAFADEWTPRLLRRESQALARLDHSGIAAIHEAGQDRGCCYFAMELVEGLPLTTFAAQRRLSIRERLDLFRRVCDAVHYAHQRGVIHRDLKPSNILVTEAGQPKVLDFGLARITDPDGEFTRVTNSGCFHGTLAYSSPEHVQGCSDDIDVRSDVYSLGIVLHELLSGERPYDLGGLSLPQAARVICEHQPTPLGARSPSLRGDLATISAKALQKEPDRRYASVADLASDVARYLRNEPISARPASLVYHVRKLARRHRLAFAATASFALIVIGLAIGMGVLYVRAAAAERQALAEAANAKKTAAQASGMSEFSWRMFAAADPYHKGSLPETMDDLLEYGARRILKEGALSDYPFGQSQMLEQLGLAMKSRGRLDRAAELLDAAFVARQRFAGADEPPFAASLANLATFFHDINQFQKAEDYNRRALKIFHTHYGPDNYFTATVQANLAKLIESRDPLMAEAMHRETLRVYRMLADPIHVGRGLRSLASCLHRLGRFGGAEQLHVDALAIHEINCGERALLTGEGCHALGRTLTELGRYREAEEHLLRAEDIFREVTGDASPALATNHLALARLNEACGDLQGSRERYQAALTMSRQIFGNLHLNVADALDGLGSLRASEADAATVLRLFEESLAIRRKLLKADHPELATCLHRFGMALLRLECPLQALPLFEEEISIRKGIAWDQRAGYAAALQKRGETLLALEREDEAAQLLQEARAVQRGEDSP